MTTLRSGVPQILWVMMGIPLAVGLVMALLAPRMYEKLAPPDAWAAFVASPSGETAERAAQAVEAGARPPVTEFDVATIDRLVAQGVGPAIRLAVTLHFALDAHLSEELGVLAGHGITSNAVEFLRALAALPPEERAGTVCANLGAEFVDQPDLEKKEAARRKALLLAVAEPALVPARDRCIASLAALQ